MYFSEEPVKARIAGHFGEWLQGRLGPNGPVALLTVPCAAFHVEVERVGGGPLSLVQSPEILSLNRAKHLIEQVGGRAGRYRLTATMPPGGGAGASTAALVALSKAAGGRLDDLASACIAVEGACDPLMLRQPDRVLWASRAGHKLRDVAPLPRAEVIGGFWGAPIATDPTDDRFPDISDLVEWLIPPVSLKTLAKVASLSAQRCSALRGPADDPTAELARTLGALGYLRAHTGSARGLIYAPGTVPAQADAVLREAGFDRVVQFATGGM